MLPNEVGDVVELLSVILLGIFSGLPEAYGNDPIRIAGGYQRDFIYKSVLIFQDW
jgi:hypothetical protein